MIKIFDNFESFLQSLNKKFSNTCYYFKGIKKYDLILYDDLFPNPVSGFRLEELTVLLNTFKASKIIANSSSYSYLKAPIDQHEQDIKVFVEKNKSLKKKILFKKKFININSKLFYCIFINNIHQNLYWLERFKIPFIFTLYPGGGFILNDDNSDLKLKQVFSSSMFKKVIVTQSFTKQYLIDKSFCLPEKIEFIFGGVVPLASLKKHLGLKQSYLENKTTFDICFCAAKYMAKGKDKGYDTFISVAKNIATKFDFVYFHIIGGFDENDIEIKSISDKITFYGYKNFEYLSSVFIKMDVIISPNQPFVLSKGAFDGFPLGAIVEAVFNGVVALVTDELNENKYFIPNEEIVIIENDSNLIENEIINLINQPKILYHISKRGRLKFQEIYSFENQLETRIKLLNAQMIND